MGNKNIEIEKYSVFNLDETLLKKLTKKKQCQESDKSLVMVVKMDLVSFCAIVQKATRGTNFGRDASTQVVKP